LQPFALFWTAWSSSIRFICCSFTWCWLIHWNFKILNIRACFFFSRGIKDSSAIWDLPFRSEVSNIFEMVPIFDYMFIIPILSFMEAHDLSSEFILVGSSNRFRSFWEKHLSISPILGCFHNLIYRSFFYCLLIVSCWGSPHLLLYTLNIISRFIDASIFWCLLIINGLLLCKWVIISLFVLIRSSICIGIIYYGIGFMMSLLCLLHLLTYNRIFLRDGSSNILTVLSSLITWLRTSLFLLHLCLHLLLINLML
jgi:hypothetical protein